MRLSWIGETDDDGTIYLRLHPRDQDEAERITRMLDRLIAGGGYATMYGETYDVWAVTEDPEGRVLSHKGNEDPNLEIRVWRDK